MTWTLAIFGLPDLSAFGTWLWDIIQGAYVWYVAQCQQLWNWMWGHVVSLIQPAWDAVASSFPAMPQLSSDLIAWLGVVNAWVPLDIGVGLFTAYWAFWGVLMIYRLIKSWIPTVPG